MKRYSICRSLVPNSIVVTFRLPFLFFLRLSSLSHISSLSLLFLIFFYFKLNHRQMNLLLYQFFSSFSTFFAFLFYFFFPFFFSDQIIREKIIEEGTIGWDPSKFLSFGRNKSSSILVLSFWSGGMIFNMSCSTFHRCHVRTRSGSLFYLIFFFSFSSLSSLFLFQGSSRVKFIFDRISPMYRRMVWFIVDFYTRIQERQEDVMGVRGRD